jgi:hypothetical protein
MGNPGSELVFGLLLLWVIFFWFFPWLRRVSELQQFWRDTDAARKRRGLQPPSRTSFRVHFPIYLFAWRKGHFSFRGEEAL